MVAGCLHQRNVHRLIVSGILLLALGLLGCGKRGHEAPQGGANYPPSRVRLKRNVELVQVKQERMSSHIETVGYLDAEGQTEVAAGVSGVVEEVHFREGDWVLEDQTILVRIDPKRFQALVAQAQANLHRADANVKKMQAQARRGDAAVRDAEQTLDLRRVLLDNIRRSGRSTKLEERQEAQANAEVATARLEVARSEKEVCNADIAAAQKEVEAAQALLALAEHNLRRSEVRAPYTGQINQRRITRGSYLEDKTVIATMADLRRLRLVGYIPEKAAPMARQMLQQERRIRTGFLVGGAMAGPWAGLAAATVDQRGETPASYRLEFELRAFPGQTFHGRLFYLSTVADPSTHLFECKAEVPRRALDGQLRPGFSAKIRCPLPGRPSSIIVPEESVRASERGFIAFRPRVMTRSDGSPELVAEAVPLELGQRKPGWVEVLKGLNPGDAIVHRGAEALEDGTPLAIPKEQMTLLKSSLTTN